MNNVTKSIVGALVLANGALIVVGSLVMFRNADCDCDTEALVRAAALFCAQKQPSTIQQADCEHLGRQLRMRAWLALSSPDADAVGRGEDHNQ